MKKLVALILTLTMLLSMTMAAQAEGESFTIAYRKMTLDKSENFSDKAGAVYAEATTGIKINWDPIDDASFTERFNILTASGSLPDAFIGIKNANADQLISNLPLFYPLDEYLTEENAPHILAMFEAYPELKTMLTQTDGHIYSLPTGAYSIPDNQGEGIKIINQAWLEKLGLEMPTTTDELYAVLKAMKEGDPNGNNEADEIPVTFCQNNWAAHFINLLGPWGICEWEGGGDGYLKVENGTVIFTPTLDEFRAGLEFWHKMADEGLLDVEGFTQTNEQFYARLKSDTVGLYMAWTAASNLSAEKAAEFTTLGAIQSSEYPEISYVTPGEVDRFVGNLYGFVITRACSDPAALVRWYDAQNADIATKMLWRYGEEGTLWQQQEDGSIVTLWPETTEDFTRENMKYTYGNYSFTPAFVLPTENEQEGEDAPASATVRIGMVNAIKDYFPAERIPTRNVSNEKVQERNMIYTDLKAYLDSFVADCVVNGLDDAKWEKHLKDVEAYHAAEWTQWYQDYIDGKF